MAKIQKVAVLGAGTMGSRIAAHFANAGIPALLLDLLSPGDDPDAIAKRGLQQALNAKPPAFFTDSTAALIEPGNFDHHLGRLSECQWILEAITEYLDAKRDLWSRVIMHANADAILSTNTSGIPLNQISRDWPAAVKRRFLGTHFFNPPRYLHLLELIPGAETDPAIVDFIGTLAERTLGKGVVRCKDTPNFIANRIGSFYSAAIQRVMVEGNYTVEEVEALTGPLIGMPKSASFRLIDIIGLDVWAAVSSNVYQATDDPWREWFVPQPYLKELLAKGWLGDKAGQGFYKKTGPNQTQVLDWKTLEYHAPQTVSFDSVNAAKKIPDLAVRLRYLVDSPDRAGEFLGRVFRAVIEYSADVAPEICDDIADIDRAMRWGFGHAFGPFELSNVLGIEAVRTPMHKPVKESADVIDLLKATRIYSNNDASLRDLGSGVLCLEFHSKMNAIGEGTLEVIQEALVKVDTDFAAMVIANQGDNFSVGANLAALYTAAEAGNFSFIEQFIRRLQRCLLEIKYAPKPVVCAAFSRALGGGAEVVLQSHRVQAFAELYIGLVEVAVGLIPAGGGTKEMALRSADPLKGFDLILTGRVSGSAAEAKQLGYLQPSDRVSMNPDFLIGDAKDLAIELATDYLQSQPIEAVVVSGEPGYQRMRNAALIKQEKGELTQHDFTIAEKLAYVLSGGRVAESSTISEQRLLDLELEMFLQLCGMSQSQERIVYMLKNGRPLRN